MMRNNVSEGLAASELYNNNLCLLCEAIELQQNTNNNNICSDKNKRLDNKNNNTLIISTTKSIKKKHIYKRKKPCIFEGCTSLRRGGTKYCVRHGAKKYKSCCRYPGCNSFARKKGLYVKNTTHNIQGMLLDIYSQHQVNCTCQSGHAFDCWICFNLSSI